MEKMAKCFWKMKVLRSVNNLEAPEKLNLKPAMRKAEKQPGIPLK